MQKREISIKNLVLNTSKKSEPDLISNIFQKDYGLGKKEFI